MLVRIKPLSIVWDRGNNTYEYKKSPTVHRVFKSDDVPTRDKKVLRQAWLDRVYKIDRINKNRRNILKPVFNHFFPNEDSELLVGFNDLIFIEQGKVNG